MLDWITSRVEMPKVNAQMIDIDCGKGEDLHLLAKVFREQGAQVQTYGVDIRMEDVYEARKILDHVLPGGYLQCEVSHQAFSFAYCHPRPTQRKEGETASLLDEFLFSREKEIFQRLTSYLQVGGILVYRISKDRFKGLSNLIAFRLEDIHLAMVHRPERTGRHGDPGWDVLILGRKADVKNQVKQDRKAIAETRAKMIEAVEEGNLPLVVWEGPKLVAPRAPGPSIFRTSVIDPQMLQDDMRSSHLWNELHSWFEAQDQGKHRPPLPLHLGHIGLLLSTGLLDGRVGNHLMKGRVVKQTHYEHDIDEDGMEVQTERDRYAVEVRILEPDGSYFDL